MDKIQGVPLVTEPGISLVILTPMKILQRNLNRGVQSCLDASGGHFQHMLWCRCSILISGKIIKEMPGSVASGTSCIYSSLLQIS
jgi:hypothetical protein